MSHKGNFGQLAAACCTRLSHPRVKACHLILFRVASEQSLSRSKAHEQSLIRRHRNCVSARLGGRDQLLFSEWISAINPPGNCTTAARRPATP
jgi:hypothetical protein